MVVGPGQRERLGQVRFAEPPELPLASAPPDRILDLRQLADVTAGPRLGGASIARTLAMGGVPVRRFAPPKRGEPSEWF